MFEVSEFDFVTAYVWYKQIDTFINVSSLLRKYSMVHVFTFFFYLFDGDKFELVIIGLGANSGVFIS